MTDLTPKMARLLADIAAKEGGWYEGLTSQRATMLALEARGLIQTWPCPTQYGRSALKARIIKQAAPESK